MSDELQVQTPTGLQVQGSPTFQQTGSGNTQIGYIGQQINYITMGGMPQPIRPVNPNYEYYNLFVIDQEQMDSLVAIPRHQSLNDYTVEEVRKSDTIIVTASISHVIRQEKLNALESELQLLRAPENNELDCVHWAIKRVNLPQLIQEKKLIEIMDML